MLEERKVKALNTRSKMKKKSAAKPYRVFISPTFIYLVLLVVFPTVFLYYISMTNYEMGYPLQSAKFVGFRNYIRLFTGEDADFWHSVAISLLFMLVTTIAELIIGYLIAELLNCRDFKLKGLVFGCMIVPIAMTPSIAGQIWKLLFNYNYGLIDYFMNAVFHFKVIWLGSGMAFWTTVIVDIWQWTPFMTLIIYAGLRSIPAEPYESAKVDGANAYQQFRYVTLPALRPMLILVLLFRSMDSLKLFDIPYVLTQGGPGNETEFMSLHIYRLGFGRTGLIGRSAAMSVVLLVLITVISQVIIKLFQREENA